MIFVASFVLLGALLLSESLVLAYVLRGAVRVALDHEARRSSPIGLPAKTVFPIGADNRLQLSTPGYPDGQQGK